MEYIFCMIGDGFAMVADTSVVHNFLIYKSIVERVLILDSHKLLDASSERDDQINYALYEELDVGDMERTREVYIVDGSWFHFLANDNWIKLHRENMHTEESYRYNTAMQSVEEDGGST